MAIESVRETTPESRQGVKRAEQRQAEEKRTQELEEKKNSQRARAESKGEKVDTTA